MVWQALILHKMTWNFNILILVITISNSLGKIIQFQPSLSIKSLVAIAYFVIPTLSGGICCGGKQRKLARKNFDLYCHREMKLGNCFSIYTWLFLFRPKRLSEIMRRKRAMHTFSFEYVRIFLTYPHKVVIYLQNCCYKIDSNSNRNYCKFSDASVEISVLIF